MTYRASNGTADRALRVLGLFDDARPAITAADVARELGVGRSTAYRYVKGLVAAGFLAAEPGGGLTVGPRVVELAGLARRGWASARSRCRRCATCATRSARRSC